MANDLITTADLLKDIRGLIEEAKSRTFQAVNAELTLLYWHIGTRLQQEVLKGERAQYGKQTIKTLAAHLTQDFGAGWSEQQLRHCLRAAETFPDANILYALRRELSWTHLRTLMYLDDELKREFYIEMCKLEKWSARQLQDRIRSMLFERTAISRKPEDTIKNDLALLRNEGKLSQDLVFRDPYVLDFLGLSDSYLEKDLESSIVAELQKFISELGSDFAFMARQKRITIDARDYYLDLLFYHRRLRCLVAIELKIGDFEAAHKGQMELYLRYLEKYEKAPEENTPIGLILCTGKNQEHVELLQLDQSNIRVADYLTLLPPKEVLQAKLHQSIAIAQHRLAARDIEGST